MWVFLVPERSGTPLCGEERPKVTGDEARVSKKNKSTMLGNNSAFTGGQFMVKRFVWDHN